MKHTTHAAAAVRGNRLKPLAAALAIVLLAGVATSASAWVREGKVETPAVENAALTRYTIVFKQAPVASYRGDVAGYAALPKASAGRKAGFPDIYSAQANAYAGYLANRQTQFMSQISGVLGRRIAAEATMQHALNAVIVELSEAEADVVARRSEVDFVERERYYELLTDRGPAFIGAPSIWDGSATGGVPTQGEGILVGIIDTGINWESPAFAATGPSDNYVHVNPFGAGNFRGLCGPTAPNADLGRCNNKLVGMYNFTTTVSTRSGVDTQGHGSHTASTVTGNHWLAPFGGGTFNISGMAPHANVIAYLACSPGCASSATSQSVNQAVIDGVNVINFSISGGTSPWTDATSVAFLNAHNAGVFVAASAGNDGPVAGSTNHVEPWVETVAASTKDNVIAFKFNLTGPGAPPPANTQNLPLRSAAPPLPTADIVNAPIVQSPNFGNGNSDGCSPYPAGTFTGLLIDPNPDRLFSDDFEVRPRTGAIAVLNLDQNNSGCGSGVRRTAALNAGAIGVIFVDPAFINLGASGTSWSMLRADWDNAYAQIQSNPTYGRASILFPASSYAQRGDVIADFSSRGPVTVGSGQFLVKPDITAPGVDILAAFSSNLGGPNATALDNGTSMSGPHTAGAAALLKAARPTWTPMQIKSALNLTAKTSGIIKASGAPSDLWDRGSGRVDLNAAARTGLVLNETGANFTASRPSTGGNVATLNLASMANATCGASCSFTRTVSSTLTGPQDYTLSFTGLPAGAATVTPSTFTIAGGATQSFTVTVNGSALTAAQWALGEMVLTPTNPAQPTLHMPMAVKP